MLINQQKLHLNPLLSISEEQTLSNSSIHSSSGDSIPEPQWWRAFSVIVALAKEWKIMKPELGWLEFSGSCLILTHLLTLQELQQRWNFKWDAVFWFGLQSISIFSRKRPIQRASFQSCFLLRFLFWGYLQTDQVAKSMKDLSFD